MTALRETFDQWVKTVAPDRRCFFIDEAGAFIGMRRRFGRAPDGSGDVFAAWTVSFLVGCPKAILDT